VQGDFLQQSALYQRALPLINDATLGVQHALSTAVFALMVLFAIMNMAIFLEPLRVTLGTGISEGHH
jgi:hypothetical protein